MPARRRRENLLQAACFKIAGFAELLAKFEQKVTVAGKSQPTLTNYSRHLAKLALHFNELPTAVVPDRVNETCILLSEDITHPLIPISSLLSMPSGLRTGLRE